MKTSLNVVFNIYITVYYVIQRSLTPPKYVLSHWFNNLALSKWQNCPSLTYIVLLPINACFVFSSPILHHVLIPNFSHFLDLSSHIFCIFSHPVIFQLYGLQIYVPLSPLTPTHCMFLFSKVTIFRHQMWTILPFLSTYMCAPIWGSKS